MIRKRHRWLKRYRTPDECKHCGSSREIICVFGTKPCYELKTYVRSDGVRFTGQTPECDSVFKSKQNVPQALLRSREFIEQVYEDTMVRGGYMTFYWVGEERWLQLKYEQEMHSNTLSASYHQESREHYA